VSTSVEIRSGRPEAAAAIWPWRERAAVAANAAGEASRARRRGLVRGVVVAAVGALLLVVWSRVVGGIVLGVAGVILLSAGVSPTGLYAGVEGLFAALGRWTGQALTWILLVPLFYAFFLPFGCLLRRGRRDRLKRFFEAEAPTYWEPHAGPTASSGSRARQY
jgi:hypothetical protein